MSDWLIILVSFLAIGAIIGNLSLLKRSARPIRRTSLNDLEPTIKGSENLNDASELDSTSNAANKKDA